MIHFNYANKVAKWACTSTSASMKSTSASMKSTSASMKSASSASMKKLNSNSLNSHQRKNNCLIFSLILTHDVAVVLQREPGDILKNYCMSCPFIYKTLIQKVWYHFFLTTKNCKCNICFFGFLNGNGELIWENRKNLVSTIDWKLFLWCIYSRCIFSVLLRCANAIKVWVNCIKMWANAIKMPDQHKYE